MLYQVVEYNIPVRKYGLRRPTWCFAISVVYKQNKNPMKKYPIILYNSNTTRGSLPKHLSIPTPICCSTIFSHSGYL